MMVERDWIATHIPHQGNMCLLDGVTHWDDTRLTAIASSHLAPENPLRAHGCLSAVHGIEYAAQAMAVHAALLSAAHVKAAPRAGVLASVRGTTLHVMRLDDVDTILHIHVTRIHGDSRGMLYQFNVRANDTPLLEGRATIMHQEHG